MHIDIFVHPLNLVLEFLKMVLMVVQSMKNSPFCIGMKSKNDNEVPSVKNHASLIKIITNEVSKTSEATCIGLVTCKDK